ncbi:MAG TPA: hypothetical protein VFF81_12200 [Noviherbaspirillum sp.]|nr:hypothetical protein [Noviherbaspirillum sp.]
MKEQEFRNEAEDFVKWLAQYLETPTSEPTINRGVFHQWTARSNRAAPMAGGIWSCTSLYDAYQKYYWRTVNPITNTFMSTFAESAECLTQIGENLRSAIKSKNSDECLNVCEQILRWGGVQNRKVALLIRAFGEGLHKYLEAVEVLLQEGPLTNSVSIDDKPFALEVDSGTTKIYSLLSADWSIYDGRVGAALGLLVHRWTNEMAVKKVPDGLRFAWGYEQRRNPNLHGEHVFPMFGAKVDRFQQNLRLNWLLKMLLNVPESSQFQRTGQGLRALEAALFMIGYSVREGQDTYNEEAALEVRELEQTPMTIARFPQRFQGG